MSRNPSDASEKSTASSAPPDEPESERDDAIHNERDKQSVDRDDERREEESERDARSVSVDKEDNEDRNK